MKLSAVKNGNNWVLNGKKHFIACAAMSNVNFLCARTDPKVPVNEGDIIFWYPMLPHAAPVTKGLKTIISFNLNMS